MTCSACHSRNFRPARIFILAICLLTMAVASKSYAQDINASLSGTVLDPSGAVVPAAQLTLTNAATQFAVSAVSSDNGQFTLRNLTPGRYDLKVVAKNFQTSVQTGIELTINQAARLDVSLKLGTESQTVTVSADASLLNFDNPTLSGGVAPETLNNLPLTVAGAPRSSISLALLLPGVSTPSGSAYDARINGGTQSGDEALLDGATMTEGYMNQSGMVSLQGDFQMSPDMVSEVKVLSLNYEPQYGSSTSGQLIVQSRGGGDVYNGSAFEFIRNDALNAFQYGTPKGINKPVDKENNYGANIGGPIPIPGMLGLKSAIKAYFYFNWESLRDNGGASAATLSIPSLAARRGDFSNYRDASGNVIQIYDPKTGLPFPNNQIPTAQEDPIAAAWMAALPTPTNNNETNNYLIPKSGQGSLVSGDDVYMWRVDLSVHDKDHLYYTYWWQYSKPNPNSDLPKAISTASPANPENSPVQRLNWEHTFSANMTNHFTIGYLNRNEGYYSFNLGAQLPSVAGVANSTYLPQFSFGSGYSQLGSSNGPSDLNVTTRPTYAINDLFTMVFGTHTLKMGVEWRNAGGNIHSGGGQGGVFTFNSDTTANSSAGGVTGDPIAGFFLGAASGANVKFLNVPSYYPRQTVWAAHLGDTWRAMPKLTLSYGMRYDLYSPFREKNNHFSFFDPLGINPGTGNPGLKGRLAFAGNSYGAASYGRQYPEEVFKNGFAPRVGFSYAKDDKTVIRAGYGIYFGQAFYPGWNGGMSLDGFNLNDTINSVANSSGISTPAMYLQNGFPTPAETSNISSDFDNGQAPLYRPFDGNKRPYSSQWSVTVERQLPQKFFISASYIGTKGTRLPSNNNPINVLNPYSSQVQSLGIKLKDAFTGPNDQIVDGVSAPYPGWYDQVNGNCGATVAQALLPFPQYCGTLSGLNEGHGNSFYSSFQAHLERHYDHGLYINASFTEARLVSNASDSTQSSSGEGTGGNTGIITPYNIPRMHSLASDNVPNFFSIAAVYDLPFGRNKRFLNGGGFASRFVGGWQVSPIIRYNHGIPMFFTAGSCSTGSVGQLREGCIPGVLSGARVLLQNPSHYDPAKGRLLNPAAFEPASAFSGDAAFGYTGIGQRVSTIYGSSVKNMDLSLTKNTALTERITFQLRANFFNAFNNHYFASPGGTMGGGVAFNNDISNSDFGQSNGTVTAPRTIQFSGRISF
jgi:hypothetical protein